MAASNNLDFDGWNFVELNLQKILNLKTYPSSSKTYLSYLVDRLLSILLGHLAQQIYPGHSSPDEHAVSIKIVRQILQPYLDYHPDQTNHPHGQPPRPQGGACGAHAGQKATAGSESSAFILPILIRNHRL